MEIVVSHEQGKVPVTVFRVKGSLDAASYEQLQTRAKQEIDGGARNLILDLAEVPFMSSAGIRGINQIFNWLRGDSPSESDAEMRKGLVAGTFKSPHLKLVKPTPRVLEVLKMAGLDMFLEIHQNLKDAIASF
jgi:anti-anti-sigma regulatory factor